MKIHALRFLLFVFVATALTLSASGQTNPGSIKAAKVEGEVLKLSHGTSAPLKNGDVLVETDTVTTGKGASVVLVFMNGSTVKLGSETRLAIDEFKMDPLAEDIKASTLKNEPSVSKTALNLSYGEMVGDVKKLNTASSYSIKTPVGAAGIRGTVYRIVFRPAADGKAFFTVSTAEGHVVMTGVSANEIHVDAGKEVVVEIDVPDTPGGTAAAPVIVTQDLSPETKAAVTAASVTISQALQDAVITNPPPPTPPVPEKPPVPPLPQPINPDTTPGQGG
jgi:hypothetical protein